MHSVLKLRENQFSPVSETLNLSARGIKETQKIAGWYAATKDYGYWEVQFHQYANDAPRLVRNGAKIYVNPLNEEKRRFL